MNILKNEIPTNIKPNTWVGVDTEFFGMNKKQLHRPSGTFACLTIAIDHNTVLFIDKEELIAPALKWIDKCVWCIQKAMFDIVQLRRYAEIKPRKRIWDTLLVERIMFGGYYNEFNLKALVRRWLHEKLDKDIREEFINSSPEELPLKPAEIDITKMNEEELCVLNLEILKDPSTADKLHHHDREMSDEMIDYACKDAVYVLRVAQEQRKAIDEKSFRCWTDVDSDVMWPFLDMRGFPIDVEKWIGIAETAKEKFDEIEEQLPFNPRSPVALKWYKDHGFKTIKSREKEELQRCIDKYPNAEATPFAKLAVESSECGKAKSTYGKKWIDDFAEDEDFGGQIVKVIHCAYDPNKAETGRAISDDPCMTNIPTRKTKVYKECFYAPDGFVIVVVDMSAQEPRNAACITNDQYLLECFKSGRDPYISLAKDAFNETITKKDLRRKAIKGTVLGLLYGLSEYGLAREENLELDVAKDIFAKVSNMLVGVSEWANEQGKKKNYVETILGRKVWLNPYTYQCEKNARNAPIQGTAAEQVKLALVEIYKNWNYEKWGQFGFLAYVYDELVFLFPENCAEEGKQFIMKHMIEQAEKVTGNKIPFTVDAFVGRTWAEKC